MIKIAIMGVGNCACSFIQGISYCKEIGEKNVPGLLNDMIGSYKPSDIQIVAAFDIDKRKVGKDVSEAIFQKPNNTKIFCKNVKKTGVIVQRAPTFDGIPENMKDYEEDLRFVESDEKPVDVAEVLRNTRPDILINYLPVGSQKATENVVNVCLEAGVSFINAIPVFICSDEKYIKKFEEKGLVCLGDDVKAQVGATITHRALANMFTKRGVKLNSTYQLNSGGNTDFMNLMEKDRLKQKNISKTEAVQSQLSEPLDKNNIHISPSAFIPWLKDNKVSFMRMEGENFGGVPMNIELRLSVEDSPNSAGIMVDMVRCVKLALDKGMKGYLELVSAFGFKKPLKQYTDEEAYCGLMEFISKK
ncbi:MAG: inositol-3-phosphate synthase [Nanoarchaeota archaeon]|nr:inositol-3-phosphate synthase [Nanoarchaeota archaeon]